MMFTNNHKINNHEVEYGPEKRFQWINCKMYHYA